MLHSIELTQHPARTTRRVDGVPVVSFLAVSTPSHAILAQDPKRVLTKPSTLAPDHARAHPSHQRLSHHSPRHPHLCSRRPPHTTHGESLCALHVRRRPIPLRAPVSSDNIHLTRERPPALPVHFRPCPSSRFTEPRLSSALLPPLSSLNSLHRPINRTITRSAQSVPCS